jgi:cation transport regulator
MPYEKLNQLPEQVKSVLPIHGQEIYQAAYNNAWNEYKDPNDRKNNATREETAHKVAWAAVKKVYRKNSNGEWVR